ncbi:CesT family type III secretion system chaperone [Pleurocapsales cyanobacterium LEGE 06147]|nr:CesT family type III secretion system chaperone [Pleurocapsales cyanobacterium LEGE 06147]
MKVEEITTNLNQLFGSDSIKHQTADTWEIEKTNLRLLVILSENHSWLRILVPIARAIEARALLPQLLEANFAATGEVRYALEQNVVWGVFHHRLASLTQEDFQEAITSLIALAEKGLSELFNQLIEQRIRQIIQAAKLQGQSLETTLQTLERMYQEGMLGGLDQDPQEREQFLAAWQYQLERLWSEVEISDQ